MGDGLPDDAAEDVLRHTGVVTAPPPVLAQDRGIEHPIGQAQPQEPAITSISRTCWRSERMPNR